MNFGRIRKEEMYGNIIKNFVIAMHLKESSCRGIYNYSKKDKKLPKEMLNKTKIEKRAIHFLELPIVECDYLDSSINSMDKELSWDGYIYTYHSKTFGNNTFDDKIPIQVKGHWDDQKKEINKKNIQYPVDLDVLENYYNDRGVLYFKIVMNGDKKEIFYSILYPSKIKGYLDEARRKKNKKQINVVLTKLQPKASEMLRICRQFTFESNKQGSGRGQIVPKTVCVNDIGKYKSLQATAMDTDSPIEFAKRLSVGDACFYVQDNSDIWFPVSTNNVTEYFGGQRVVKNISVGGKVFYSNYEIICGTDDSFSIRVSENLTLQWSKGKIDFKEKGYLEELNNDALFLKAMVNSTQIEVAGVSLTYNNCKIPQEIMEEWNFIVDLYKICEMANMKILIPLKDFSVYDRKYAQRLVDILHGKIEVVPDTLYTYEMKINDKIYPFLICRDGNGKIQFVNRIYESRYQGYVKVGEKHYKVPMFCDMPRGIFGHLYKYDYADLRYQIENTEFNSETISTLHSAVIALISAYDISNESELLEIAEMMLNKMYEVDSTIIYEHINEWQIMKRKNAISDDEINKMKHLLKKCGDDVEVSCAIYALLDDKENAHRYFEKMAAKEKEEFKEFPIYKYVE